MKHSGGYGELFQVLLGGETTRPNCIVYFYASPKFKPMAGVG